MDQDKNRRMLGSDHPQTDPSSDLYGYAGLASSIANTIKLIPCPRGLVMSVHGQWGSGKTSLLNFIKHNLNEAEEIKVIDFNPWWFEGRDELAKQFLSQFNAHLKNESESLRKVGDLMAEYSAALGKAVSVSTGVPWIDKIVGFLLRLLKRQPKDIPKLKSEISDKLKDSKMKFLFIIDDIDRLTPDEIRECFKVIKALADFPNVIYILSFDWDVVSNALQESLKVDGSAYLEKIIQAPFVLPVLSRQKLRNKLFHELDEILESLPLFSFDKDYWGNVYYDGLDDFIRRPRDTVRVVNSLCVTYPTVAGEVNAVDYIALEFLKVFEPTSYGVIRENKDKFSGDSISGERYERESLKAFHDRWVAEVSEANRGAVKSIVSRLFPKVGAVFGGTGYGADWLAQWRRDLRVCSPDLWDLYFQFSVPATHIRNAEITHLLSLHDANLIKEILLAENGSNDSVGNSRAQDYIDRIQDYEKELTLEFSKAMLEAIADIADDLLRPASTTSAILETPLKWQLLWLVNHLLDRVPQAERDSLLVRLSSSGHAVGFLTYLVSTIEDYLNSSEKHDAPLAKVSKFDLDKLRDIIVERVSRMDPAALMKVHDISVVMHILSGWKDMDAVREIISPLFGIDEFLPMLIESYSQISRSHASGDAIYRRNVFCNPNAIKDFVDIFDLEPRIKALLDGGGLINDQKEAAISYLKNMDKIRAGINPDGLRDE